MKQFCKQQGLTEYSFYAWRKRLRRQAPVRFAMVEKGMLPGPSTETSLELVLTRGPLGRPIVSEYMLLTRGSRP